MYSAAIISCWIIMATIILLRYHWKRRHLYILASKLPGPLALPILGNGLKFMCTTEDVLMVISNMLSGYSKPVRMWFGPYLLVCFTHPKHIEKILSSSKLTHKHDIYDNILKIYLGDGLVTNSGEKYKRHKRLIQPLFNLKYFSANVDVFQKHIDLLVNELNEHVSERTFDVHKYIHNCFADIIGELILGTQLGSQFQKNGDYIKANKDLYDVCYERLMRPWFHPDIIYNLTARKKDQERVINVTTSFIRDKIRMAWMRTNENDDDDITSPIIDEIAKLIKNNKDSMNDIDFLYHMYTLYVAVKYTSEDTMTIITAMLVICFGMYPEYQKLAANEIHSVLGEDIRTVTYDDISKLHYLDMCTRDVLRLIPIAPFIVRKTVEDFELDDITIPKDCGLLISIFDLHRDPQYWENPDHFHPDHFLPEAVKGRHPYAYVPFSAGPRSCIGRILAFIGIKLMMVNILQRFEIEADGKFPDVVLKSDISVRSHSGYKIRLNKRTWT